MTAKNVAARIIKLEARQRVGGGTWIVSKVALAMFLDGDIGALSTYLAGDRSSNLVKKYFDRVGVPLPEAFAK